MVFSNPFVGKRTVLFDLDGTVYYGNTMIPGANAAIEACRDNDMKVMFLTNNSTKTRQQIFEKLQGLGVDCRYDEVMTSGYAAALHASQRGIADIFICGSEDLESEFAGLGVSIADEEGAKNLFIGYDPDFDYRKLTAAVRVALKAESIIACNRERVFRGEGARIYPGCGGMVAPIEWCSGRSVDYVIGKPNARFIELACIAAGCGVEDAVMVGDTYESDIAMARAAGCAALLIGEDEGKDTITIDSVASVAELVG